jgi:hypothetical protein
MGLDTKTYLLTDRQSQYDLTLTLARERESSSGVVEERSVVRS